MSSMNHRGQVLITTLCLTVAGALTASDALSQLGVSADIARQEVMAGIARGQVDYAVAAPAFKVASGAARAELARGAVAWARHYTASTEFKAAYAEMRDARKPSAPEFTGTPEDEFQEMLDAQNREIEKSKAALVSMDPETRKQMEGALGQAAAAMRQLDMPEMRNRQLAGIRHARAESTAKHERVLKAWEAEVPQDPAIAVARRLKAFLDVSADVDFAAALEERNGAMRFVNAAYERKSSEWKLCYRVGKDAVDAARDAAAAWLSELESARTGTVNERP